MTKKSPYEYKPKTDPVASEPAPQPVEPSITIDRFMGGKAGALAFAFVKTEKLRYGVRKLTRKEWAAEYDRFLTEPR